MIANGLFVSPIAYPICKYFHSSYAFSYVDEEKTQQQQRSIFFAKIRFFYDKNMVLQSLTYVRFYFKSEAFEKYKSLSIQVEKIP